jgi:hypothetical protein
LPKPTLVNSAQVVPSHAFQIMNGFSRVLNVVLLRPDAGERRDAAQSPFGSWQSISEI